MNVIMKVGEYGKDEMAWHMIANKGMTYKKFFSMPPRHRAKLNDPNEEIPVKSRNRVRNVKAKNLTQAQVFKVVSGRQPRKGILPPDEQNDTRPYEPGDGPTYFSAVNFECHPSYVLVFLEQNRAKIRCRIKQAMPGPVGPAMGITG